MDTIGFIGVGNMGSAILKGIAGSSLKQETSLFAYNPTEAKVDALANCGVQKCGSAAEVVEKSQYVFLAIKPQKFEEVLPQSSFFRRFPVPDLEISSPEESRGEGRARAVLRALGCEPVPLSRQGGEEGLFAVIPGKDAAPGMILCVSDDRREYAGLCRAVDAAAIPSWPSGERPGWAAWTNGDV